MFRRFRPKIRVYENHRHECSFKTTFNWLIWNDVELGGLQTCYSVFSKFWTFRNISKFSTFFPFFKIVTLKTILSPKKNLLYVRGQWLINMCAKFQVDIFINGWDVKSHFSRHFGTLPWFPEFSFFDRFWRCVRCLRVIFRVLYENLT